MVPRTRVEYSGSCMTTIIFNFICFFLHQKSIREPQNPPGIPGALVIMRDHDDGHAVGIELFQEVHHLLDDLSIQVPSGLIDQYFSTGLQESARLNYWEFRMCGREVGGTKAQELGVCPTYPDYVRHAPASSGHSAAGKCRDLLPGSLEPAGQCSFYRSRHYDWMFDRRS